MKILIIISMMLASFSMCAKQQKFIMQYEDYNKLAATEYLQTPLIIKYENGISKGAISGRNILISEQYKLWKDYYPSGFSEIKPVLDVIGKKGRTPPYALIVYSGYKYCKPCERIINEWETNIKKDLPSNYEIIIVEIDNMNLLKEKKL